MSETYDVILIGGEHNALIAAAYSARKGLRTLLIERRNHLGAAAATEEANPGYLYDTGSGDSGLFRSDIASELSLWRYGLEFLRSDVASLSLLPAGGSLTLRRDPSLNRVEIERHSPADATHFRDFANLMEGQVALVAFAMGLTPPEVPFDGLWNALPGFNGWLRSVVKTRS